MAFLAPLAALLGIEVDSLVDKLKRSAVERELWTARQMRIGFMCSR